MFYCRFSLGSEDQGLDPAVVCTLCFIVDSPLGSEDQGLGHSVGTTEDGCEADIEDFDGEKISSVNTSLDVSLKRFLQQSSAQTSTNTSQQ